MTERELEATDEGSEDDSGFLLVTNAGVFAGLGDRKADHDACNTVWNMVEKARANVRMRGGSIAQTMREQLEAKRGEVIVAETTTTETNEPCREDTMAKTNEEVPRKRGDFLKIVLEAHEGLRGQLGRQPTGREVFDHLGESVAKSIANVSMTMRRLVARGELKRSAGKSGPSRTATPEARTARKKSPRPPPRVVNEGGHPTNKGPVVLSRDFGTLPIRPDIAAKAESDPALAAVLKKRNQLADRVAQLTQLIEEW